MLQKPVLQPLLEREITRKQFIQILFGAGLSLFGLHNFLGNLQHLSDQSERNNRHGFGAGWFGR